jgi:hypothetical protein
MLDWKVSTPINQFVHLETGSQIDIVSTVHVGQPSYYQALGSYIMARQDEGFAVHYESIAAVDKAEPTNILERMKWRVHEAHIDASADSLVLAEVGSKYTIQDDEMLFRRSGSENHDITNADLVHQTTLAAALGGLMSAKKLRRKLEKASGKGPDILDEAVFSVLKEEVDKFKAGRTRTKGRDKITIGLRNQVALEGVDAVLAENPAAQLVLIWGIGHLAGLKSGLFDRGYTHTYSQEIYAAISRARLNRVIKRDESSLGQTGLACHR